MPDSNDQARSNELHAGLLEEAQRHREFLHASLRWTTGLIFVFVTVAGVAAATILDEQLAAAAHSVVHETNVAERIEEKVQEQLSIIPELTKESIEAQAPALAIEEVKRVLTAESRKAIEEAVAETLENVKGLDAQEVRSLLLSVVPIGTVVARPGQLPPKNDPWHERWHVCDGSLLSKDEHSALLQSFGGVEAWPYGQEETTFMLPDFRGMFLRGLGEGSAPFASVQSDTFARHNHLMFRKERATKDVAEELTPTMTPSTIGELHTGQFSYAMHGKKLATGPRVGVTGRAGAGDETRPVNLAVHWVMRVK